MKSINVEIGNRLKEFRKDLNLSQSQFSRKLNQTTIGSIILLTKSRTHLFTPAEIEILKQASAHLTSALENMLEEVKKDCPDFLDIPLKDNGKIIGKLFVDYRQRENDQPFKEEINKILLGTADALARLMYT